MLYIGPDTLMPIASAFAAVVGVLVMFWQKTVSAARFVGRLFRRREDHPAPRA